MLDACGDGFPLVVSAGAGNIDGGNGWACVFARPWTSCFPGTAEEVFQSLTAVLRALGR